MLMGYPLSDVILHRFDHFLFELFELVELQKGTEKVREQEGKERVRKKKNETEREGEVEERNKHKEILI